MRNVPTTHFDFVIKPHCLSIVMDNSIIYDIQFSSSHQFKMPKLSVLRF